jgi:hypothetical protein
MITYRQSIPEVAVDNLFVSRDDIDALAQLVATGTLPAQDLLRSLVIALREATGDDDPVSMSVEVGSVAEQFEAGFVPEAAPAGQHIRVTFAKIGR